MKEEQETAKDVMEKEELSEEEDEKLPFANARVVRIIKANWKNEHQVKMDVKLASNLLLGEMLADIAQSMDKEDHFTLSIEHFNKAARKYREIGLNKKRVLRIQKVLEKQRAELDEIVTEIDLDFPADPSVSQ